VTRLVGHGLRNEGAAYDDRGYPLDAGGYVVRSGPGRAKCECGELSEVLPSTSARKAWHRQHKAEVPR